MSALSTKKYLDIQTGICSNLSMSANKYFDAISQFQQGDVVGEKGTLTFLTTKQHPTPPPQKQTKTLKVKTCKEDILGTVENSTVHFLGVSLGRLC